MGPFKIDQTVFLVKSKMRPAVHLNVSPQSFSIEYSFIF